MAAAAACSDEAPSPPEHVTWFEDATERSGAAAAFEGLQHYVYGLAAADVDGDGALDVVAAGGASGLTLLVNAGGLQLADATAAAGLADAPAALGVAAGDVDGDGDADLFAAGEGGLRLYRNDGAGAFADATAAAGLDATPPSAGVLLVDVDGDGATDVLSLSLEGPRMLYRQAGGGAFAPFAGDVLVAEGSRSWAAAAIDHEQDGDTDVVVGFDALILDDGERPQSTAGAVGGPDRLYRADGAALAEVGQQTGIGELRSTMGIVFEDMTGDGLADLFFSDWGRDDLYAAAGDGTYADATDAAGLGGARRVDAECPAGDEPAPYSNCWHVGWGAAYEDFDLDGLPDLVVAGAHFVGDLPQPVRAWRQVAPGRFAEVDLGLGWHAARGLVAADLDADGDVDVALAARESIRVLENSSASPDRAQTVYARGRGGNADGRGARVTVEQASGATRTRWIGVGGVPHSSAPAAVVVSAGEDPAVRLRVRWPGGVEQVVEPMPPGATVEIVEP